MRLLVIVITLVSAYSHFEGFKYITDLTWNFDKETVYWPNNTALAYTKTIANKERGYWYAANAFCTSEHGGTHFDAPYHFNEKGWKVSDVPLIRLVSQGVLVNLKNKTESLGANATLEVSDLEEWQAEYGDFPAKSILLVKFGWSKFWPNKILYLGESNDGTLHFPGISEAAADWLAKSGKFFGVGLDTASADPGSSTDFKTHRIFANNSMYIMENVKMDVKLPPKGFSLIVMPMKLKDGTGAPLRLLAVSSDSYA